MNKQELIERMAQAKPGKVFFKQLDFLCSKVDSANTKTLAGLLRQNLIQAVSTQERSGLVHVHPTHQPRTAICAGAA